MMNPMNIR